MESPPSSSGQRPRQRHGVLLTIAAAVCLLSFLDAASPGTLCIPYSSGTDCDCSQGTYLNGTYNASANATVGCTEDTPCQCQMCPQGSTTDGSGKTEAEDCSVCRNRQFTDKDIDGNDLDVPVVGCRQNLPCDMSGVADGWDLEDGTMHKGTCSTKLHFEFRQIICFSDVQESFCCVYNNFF